MFFFKHKTADEVRISDWSSDVCSSELDYDRARISARAKAQRHKAPSCGRPAGSQAFRRSCAEVLPDRDRQTRSPCPIRHRSDDRDACHARLHSESRSEEHTSELQSLMRNSYAGFCLKKKKK